MLILLESYVGAIILFFCGSIMCWYVVKFVLGFWNKSLILLLNFFCFGGLTNPFCCHDVIILNSKFYNSKFQSPHESTTNLKLEPCAHQVSWECIWLRQKKMQLITTNSLDFGSEQKSFTIRSNAFVMA